MVCNLQRNIRETFGQLLDGWQCVLREKKTLSYVL